MNITKNLEKIIDNTIRQTSNTKEKTELRKLRDSLPNMPEEQKIDLYLELMDSQNIEDVQFEEIPSSVNNSPPELMSNSGLENLPAPLDQGGITTGRKTIKHFGKEYTIEEKKIKISQDPVLGTIIDEKHWHRIDCPHISRRATKKCMCCNSFTCGDSTCSFECIVCKKDCCINCARIVRDKHNNVEKAFCPKHKSFFYTWFY